jgi:hypothetical protein
MSDKLTNIAIDLIGLGVFAWYAGQIAVRVKSAWDKKRPPSPESEAVAKSFERSRETNARLLELAGKLREQSRTPG